VEFQRGAFKTFRNDGDLIIGHGSFLFAVMIAVMGLTEPLGRGHLHPYQSQKEKALKMVKICKS